MSNIEKTLKEYKAFFEGKTNDVEVVTVVTHAIPVRPDFNGAIIKDLRKTIGTTQIGLADLIGVSTRTVESWESNRAEPNRPAQKLLTLLMEDKSFAKKLALI